MLVKQTFPGSILRRLSSRYGSHAPGNTIAGLPLLAVCMSLANGCTASADNAIAVEGDAIVRIWLRLDGGDKQERELHTGSKMPNAVDYANFSIGLVVLHPAAIAGRAIAPADYIATIRVARGTSGGKVIY